MIEGLKPDHVEALPNAESYYQRQLEFILCNFRNAAFIGGIGSGKSYAGAIRAIRASEGFIGDRAIPTPNLGVITAPTYPMLRDATRRTFFELAGDKVKDFNKSENVAVMANGSEVLFRSADNPERLRGPNLSWWFGDEAALYVPTVWKIMLGRLRQFGQRGYAWIATTPRGRNWVYQEFVDRERTDYAIYKAKTSENPYLDPEFIEGLRQAYHGDFALQELDAEFVAFEGLIYPEFRRDIHVTSVIEPHYDMYMGGVDWGYANPGVVLVFGVDSDKRMTLIEEHYERQTRVEEWAKVAAQLQQKYRMQGFWCDPSEPDFISAFQAEGVYAEEANNEVLTGIQAVQNRLVLQGDDRPRLLIHNSCVHTISEFESYIWMEHSKDGIQDKPRKANDHALDALRYAAMAIEETYAPIGEIHYGSIDSPSAF